MQGIANAKRMAAYYVDLCICNKWKNFCDFLYIYIYISY